MCLPTATADRYVVHFRDNPGSTLLTLPATAYSVVIRANVNHGALKPALAARHRPVPSELGRVVGTRGSFPRHPPFVAKVPIVAISASVTYLPLDTTRPLPTPKLSPTAHISPSKDSLHRLFDRCIKFFACSSLGNSRCLRRVGTVYLFFAVASSPLS